MEENLLPSLGEQSEHCNRSILLILLDYSHLQKMAIELVDAVLERQMPDEIEILVEFKQELLDIFVFLHFLLVVGLALNVASAHEFRHVHVEVFQFWLLVCEPMHV